LAIPARLRVEVVEDLQKWGLLFCNYTTYRDLFGEPEGGMVPLEVVECHLAYDEWERYRKARERWDEEHKGAGPDEQFDTEGYITDRVYCIERDFDRVPEDPA
jgi:hypothetical protein